MSQMTDDEIIQKIVEEINKQFEEKFAVYQMKRDARHQVMQENLESKFNKMWCQTTRLEARA
jgi:hypothetical protein